MTARVHVEPITHSPAQALTAEAQPAAVSLLARSFQHQPHFTDLFADPRVRARALPHVFAALYRDALQHGRIDLATRAGKLAGIAVWYPPWAYPLSIGRQLATLPHLGRMARTAVGSLRRVTQFQATTAELHPPQPYWYLAAVGVDPAVQGAGAGTRLLEFGLAEADASIRPSYLETHTRRLVTWYRKLGFEVLEGDVSFTPGGPPNWTMWRPPGSGAV